ITTATARSTNSYWKLRPVREPTSTVRKPTMKTPRAAATRAVRAASLSIPGRRESTISDLFDLRFAEQPGRPEDQDEHEDGEGRDVLVFAGEVAGQEDLDKADQQAAQHGARQRADAAQHGGGECLDAGQEADEEVDQAVIHQEQHAGDGGQR